MNDYEPRSDSPVEGAPGATAVEELRPRGRRLLSKRTGGLLVAAGLTCAVAGLAGAGTSSAADASSASPADTPTATATPPGGGGVPVTSPEPGGATGIVDTTSASGFTFATAEGVEVTVDESSATKYEFGILPARASEVKKGASVLVLGTVSTATIAATQVVVQPGGDGGAAAAKAAGVLAPDPGTTSPVQSVGQIPADYTEGDGTIVTGSVADRAVAAAQAVVPGGVVDRVVKLSDGDYEVHNIIIKWPHHVFLNKDFKVIGWE